jgi:hypothetical protein
LEEVRGVMIPATRLIRNKNEAALNPFLPSFATRHIKKIHFLELKSGMPNLEETGVVPMIHWINSVLKVLIQCSR